MNPLSEAMEIDARLESELRDRHEAEDSGDDEPPELIDNEQCEDLLRKVTLGL